ncbi:MAG: SMP-30/gluconolactonase/LRE family protein [Candidatus Azobacteroides sp.]|nr:SMP-30/gluconolactonase/LRE family protein [Candidatus Azobacteroides sp.]
MSNFKKYCGLIMLFLSPLLLRAAEAGESVFKQKPDDPEAVYFIPANYGVTGKDADLSDALQQVINQLKTEKNFGIVFFPEGSYRISKTIYIPPAIRLIGYGAKRPEIILTKNSPGYQQEVESDKGKANYMFWFTGRIVENDGPVQDAGAGTFYSALSNINLRIEDGNPYAVALRTHFAQHSFISHADVYIGKGKAGLFDVGNEMENVRFFGGDYGIYTTKTSPSWQMMMVDTYFEGQRKAAIRTQQAGLTMIRLQAKNVPTVIEVDSSYFEKLYMEDCLFDNVKSAAISFTNEYNAQNQISLRNIFCRNVPRLIFYRNRGAYTSSKEKIYRVKNYTHGLNQDDLQALPEIKTVADIVPASDFPAGLQRDIPDFPPMNDWVSVKDLGAKGDGVTDDTQAFLNAIANHPNIYVPQGRYIISESLVLKPNTNLIGLNPISTQLILNESTPAFSGFGSPKPLLETPQGGTNIVNGIGLNTGGYNYRAVGCKWMAGEKSYMNDVKFIGGHGTMSREPAVPRTPTPKIISSPTNPVTAQGLDLAWDNQYWSLWITNGGGGIFKDIWTANTYAASGIYVNNTSTKGRIYAMSIEHHVRNEATFKNVSDWKIYALQQEQETREGQFCQPIELINCSNMLFANLYLFRVIRVITPYPQAIRTWNCKNIEFLNIHNFTQNRYQYTVSLYDVNTDTEVYPWEMTRLYITGKETREEPLRNTTGIPDRLARGFEFAEGICSDSKGNVYFSEQRLRRIYRWSVETHCVELIADFPWEPLSLACDTKDHLLVIFKYNPQPGYTVNGEQETVPVLPDAAGTTFSAWGNSGWAVWVYSIDPNNPEETIQKLPKRPMGSVSNVQKAIYPAHRWRDTHDFNTISVTTPAECFVAPDGVTIIPEVYDLGRSTSVLEAVPGKPFYAVDEWDGRTVKMDVDNYGKLSNLKYFVETGEFGSAVDKEGNLYLGVGRIYKYDKNGSPTGIIKTLERPTSLCFGGADHNVLFFTSRSSLFSVKVR